MPDALGVELNRSDHHAIEPVSDSFETDGPFVVRIHNHGEGSHVHCSLSGDLASTATVAEDNPFLEPDETVEIPIEVPTDLRPARGTLELSTGYGRESVAVGVVVHEPSEGPTSPIEPDREASGTDANATGGKSREPVGVERDAPAATDLVERARALGSEVLPRRDAGTGLLAALSVVAIAIAVVAWQVVEGPVVFLAVLVVLATVLGTAIALVRE